VKKILLFSFSFILMFSLLAQQNQVDSLKNAIKKNKGKEQIPDLLKLADIYLNYAPEQSIFYSELALKKSKEVFDLESATTAAEKIGNAYLLTGNIEKAYSYFNIILEETPPISDPKYCIKLLLKQGKIYDNLGEFDKALNSYQNSLRIAEGMKDSLYIGRSLNNIGYIYFLMQDYPAANKNFYKALECFLKLKNQEGISDSYNRLGIIYGITNSNDSALYCFKKALSLKKRNEETEKIIVILENIGEVFLQKNLPDSSLFYFYEANNILIKQNAIYELAYLQNYLGKAYILKKDYKKAYEILTDAAKRAKNLRYWYLSEIYSTISDYYAAINDHKNAYNYLKMHYQVKDSIFNVKKKYKVSELLIRYETNEKEKQINTLNKENELSQSNLKKKNIIIILSVFGILIIATFTIIIHSALTKRNKANRLLNSKNKEINLQRQEILLKNELLERQKQEIISQKESLEDTNAELGKINVYLEKLSNKNVHTELAVIIASDKGKVERTNLGFFNMFGYSELEFSGYIGSIENWFSNDEYELINSALKAKESINFETIHKTKAEVSVFVQSTIIPVTDSTGNIVKIIAIETEIAKF
jgi:tetratricopeptide (TPR) repeat protein